MNYRENDASLLIRALEFAARKHRMQHKDQMRAHISTTP